MALDKNDLTQIKKIVDGSVGSAINGVKEEIFEAMSSQKEEIFGSVGSAIKDAKEEIFEAMSDQKREIIGTLTREIEDLSEINRAVISKIDNVETRVGILEVEVGV